MASAQGAQGEEKAFFAKRNVQACAKRRNYETNSTRPDSLLLGASVPRECPWRLFGNPQVADFARGKCVICREPLQTKSHDTSGDCRLRNELRHWDRPRGLLNGLVGETLCKAHPLDARQAKTTKRTVQVGHSAERILSPFLRIRRGSKIRNELSWPGPLGAKWPLQLETPCLVGETMDFHE